MLNLQLIWVNNYHKNILKIVGGEIMKRGNQKLYQWLTTKTEPILIK